jgi:hypothetical protein
MTSHEGEMLRAFPYAACFASRTRGVSERNDAPASVLQASHLLLLAFLPTSTPATEAVTCQFRRVGSIQAASGGHVLTLLRSDILSASYLQALYGDIIQAYNTPSLQKKEASVVVDPFPTAEMELARVPQPERTGVCGKRAAGRNSYSPGSGVLGNTLISSPLHGRHLAGLLFRLHLIHPVAAANSTAEQT